MINPDIAEMLKSKGYAKERIVADSAEPKSIAELRKLGIPRVTAAFKGPDSVRHGIQRVRGYRMYVHPRCCNTMMELSNYVWDTKPTEPQTINPLMTITILWTRCDMPRKAAAAASVF